MEEPRKQRSHGLQMIGSLIAALLIVIGTIWAVTARLGPTSIAEREAAEDSADEQADRLEETREEAADEDRGQKRRRRGRDR